jgi:hypothetical protein
LPVDEVNWETQRLYILDEESLSAEFGEENAAWAAMGLAFEIKRSWEATRYILLRYWRRASAAPFPLDEARYQVVTDFTNTHGLIHWTDKLPNFSSKGYLPQWSNARTGKNTPSRHLLLPIR